ncbi:hypothetical protein HUJ05_000772 [Dendroctonus ponderosae]|nr:hypothetical protein HUJ05_000772 [Dendroctonus ponderosae]
MKGTTRSKIDTEIENSSDGKFFNIKIDYQTLVMLFGNDENFYILVSSFTAFVETTENKEKQRLTHAKMARRHTETSGKELDAPNKNRSTWKEMEEAYVQAGLIQVDEDEDTLTYQK